MYGFFIGKPSLPPPPVSKLPPISQLYIFGGIAVSLLLLLVVQKPPPKGRRAQWLPPPGETLMGEKREYEVWVLKYSLVWMGAFAIIIALQLYETFTALTYFLVCGGLGAPLVLRELIPGGAGAKGRPLGVRHGVRAQLWIAIFGFIGNYWYTHYFYCVLRAKYTVPAWRLNDVPICAPALHAPPRRPHRPRGALLQSGHLAPTAATGPGMYLATHFYFSSYHVFSNLVLRRVRTGFGEGARRTALAACVIGALAYFTAFMETLTISHFPYCACGAPPVRVAGFRAARASREHSASRAPRQPPRDARGTRPPRRSLPPPQTTLRTATWRTRWAPPSTASTLSSPSPSTSGRPLR